MMVTSQVCDGKTPKQLQGGKTPEKPNSGRPPEKNHRGEPPESNMVAARMSLWSMAGQPEFQCGITPF